MPPKRKAAATTKAEPAPKKRTTRANNDDDSASSPPKPSTTTKSKAKAKAKKETIIIDSSDAEDSDVMVLDAPQPKASSSKATKSSTKQTKAKKEPAPKKEKARTTKTKVAAPLADPIPEAPPAATKAKASPKKVKPVSWEEGLKEWFSNFEDEDDQGKMGGDGIEKLFEEMDVSMEGVLPFLLAWKLNAKPGTFGSFFLSDMETVFREPKINTTSGLKKYLLDVEKTLYPSSASAKQTNHYGAEGHLRDFYTFLFPYLKDEGQKSLNGEMAVAVWGIVLGPKYAIAKSFVEYASSLGASFKGVSPDVWSQLLEFVQTVGDDLSGWSEEDAWPSTIDSFVEWKQKQDKKAETA
ncbi:Cullin binding-domain-containing protein [Leucosporidium creatinivorum]|uniref:Defective in cullin neddylation protein n=1 Tax=Leucosporidium creatinivorum TaxID=106004 RepID=A0A1Y2D7R4_9BASI|nr:Cullin binding-domain-containing protein [Leucosporidium creatinivorum]